MRKFWVFPALVLIIVISLVLSPTASSKHQPVHYQNQVAVLMYHHVHSKDTSSSTITPELFRDQLEWLKDKGYHFISLSDLTRYLDGWTVPDNAVYVTFDDGYESFYDEAFPILTDLKIPALNHIITGNLEDPKAGYMPYVTYSQIAEMRDRASFIDFGCHSDQLHRKLPDGEAALVGRLSSADGTKETDEAYKERIINDTKTCIEKLTSSPQVTTEIFAYPFGIYSPSATSFIQEAGIQFAFTIVNDMATRQSDPLLIPRINAGSPWITPERLEYLIKQKVASVPKIDSRVPLQQAVEQLGGELTVDGSTIEIQLNGKSWNARLYDSKVKTDTGEVIALREPILMHEEQFTMDWRDLETVTGIPIAYHPDTGQIIQRDLP